METKNKKEILACILFVFRFIDASVYNIHVVLLRARRNEKEMKVKPATSFKLLTIFIHKKMRQDSKQNNVSKQYLSSLCHKVPQN